MITIRPATHRDKDAVLDLAIESVSRNPLPVKISRAAMGATFDQTVGKAAHFVWVSEDGGKVVGALAAQSAYGFWFERQQASVMLYYGRTVGAIVPLLRQFARWIKSRPVLRLAVFELEPDADPRLVRFLERLGFARHSTNLTYVRGT